MALEIAEWIINSIRLESGSTTISAIWSGRDVVGWNFEVSAPDAKEAAKRMSVLPLTQSKPSPKRTKVDNERILRKCLYFELRAVTLSKLEFRFAVNFAALTCDAG